MDCPSGETVVYGGTISAWVDYSCTVGSGNILVTANNAADQVTVVA